MFSVKGQMRVSIWTITSVRERTMLTCLSVYQIPLGFRDHDKTSVGDLWAFCGFQFSVFTFPFFYVPLYIIVMPYLRHFSIFVLKNRLRLIVRTHW